ncbi:MAG: AsmA family protein [Gammaproteobacteria bacterium]|nr:MAG: AsmA family protein [Gammaproteobacteria bacterium]
MKGPLKWFGAVVGVIVLLIVAAAILLPLVIDPNDQKPAIVAQVKERIGRDLRIDGDIELSVFPWIAVELGRVELGNAAGFDNPVFASTDRISIRVKLLPLLAKRLEMGTVTVHGLTLNLARDARGRSNWDDLAELGSDAGGADGPISSSPPGSAEAGAAAVLAIGGLDIKDANLSWDDASRGQRFEINNLSIQTGAIRTGEPVDLKLALDLQMGDPAISGRVTAEGTLGYDQDRQSVRVNDFVVESEFAGEQLPGGRARITLAADLQAAIGGKPNRLTVKPLTIRLDDSVLTGELAMPDIESQALRFDVALDAIDIDRYLPPEKKSEKNKPDAAAPAVATPGSAAAAAAASEVPNQALRRLDVTGQMKIGKLKVANLNLTDVDMSVTAKDGLIKLNPIAASLYNGTYRGNISVDARGKSPRITVDENLSGVLVGPLLKDLRGRDRITGTADVNVAMQTIGATAEEVKKSLNGSARFAFTDGAINGVNVARMIREAYAGIKGTQLPAEEVQQKTDFSELRGSMRIENGIATNNDFTVMTPLLRINGRGTANLSAETVDYRVKATLVKTLEGQGGEELKDLVGIPIPIRVTGSFAEPQYALDTQALAEALAKSKVQDLIEEKIGDDTVKGLLKGLFK